MPSCVIRLTYASKCTLKVGTKINFLLLVFFLLFCNSIRLCFAQFESL